MNCRFSYKYKANSQESRTLVSMALRISWLTTATTFYSCNRFKNSTALCDHGKNVNEIGSLITTNFMCGEAPENTIICPNDYLCSKGFLHNDKKPLTDYYELQEPEKNIIIFKGTRRILHPVRISIARGACWNALAVG